MPSNGIDVTSRAANPTLENYDVAKQASTHHLSEALLIEALLTFRQRKTGPSPCKW